MPGTVQDPDNLPKETEAGEEKEDIKGDGDVDGGFYFYVDSRERKKERVGRGRWPSVTAREIGRDESDIATSLLTHVRIRPKPNRQS